MLTELDTKEKNTKTFKILIVDDTPLNIKLASTILEQEGYEVGFAIDGKSGLTKIENFHFDLILLDIMMPELDGFEVCKILKKNPHTQHIPIIFITAKNDMESIIKGFECGGVDYITKPFNSFELLARVNSQLKIIKSYRKVKDSVHNFKTLFEVSPLGKMIFDNKGSIIEINEKTIKILGCDKEQFIKNFNLYQPNFLIPTELQGEIKKNNELNFRNTLNYSELKSNYGNYLFKKKNMIELNVLITPMNYKITGDYDNGYFVQIIDITEQIVVENILDKTNAKLNNTVKELKYKVKELETSNEELEQFSSVVAHDLKNPLVSIISYFKILKMDKELDELESETFNRAIRLSRMIDSLLNYSRMKIKKVEFKPCDTEIIIRGAIDNISHKIKEANAKVTYDKPLPIVSGNSMQLLSMFQNLLENAIKYSKKDIEPQIHIKAMKDNTESGVKNYWLFSIEDNGIGIANEDIQKIFLIFKRAHSDENTYKGLGIGLAFCKKIIENHYGKIWIESELGKGTTFFFTLPKSEI